VKKGKELAISAFLLITIYGIIIIKIGKITLPHLINLGAGSHEYYVVSIILSLINPLTEELYWRLFLQKVSSKLLSL
jgi:membrane protease YdiL (CAAX protease family)